ncbi:MAG TPA: hypothetical protein VJ860_05990 [Polyangia bacterium]|jgi:hypothetical protein|nr:hypothetical protein [Polyangia bacterium]
MPLVFEEVHAAPDKKRVNQEWFILANTGASPVSTAGLQVIVSLPGKRGSVKGQIDPGFLLQPGEKILIVSGVPGKVSQGDPPTREGLRSYHLFQREGLLHGSGTILRFAMNQVDLARVTFDREAPNGIAAAKQP